MIDRAPDPESMPPSEPDAPITPVEQSTAQSVAQLFCDEMARQAARLQDGLQLLRQDWQSKSGRSTTSKAAQAIASVAALVELQDVTQLASTVAELCQPVKSSTAASATAPPAPQDLWRGTALLIELGTIAPERLNHWLRDRAAELQATAFEIAQWSQAQGSAIATDPAPIASLSAATSAPDWIPGSDRPPSTDSIEAIASPSPAPSPVEHSVASELPSDPEPIAVMPPTPTAINPNNLDPSDLADASIFDLFRLEIEAQVSILTEGLLSLEEQPNALDPLEVLMRAAHSIKGASRLVGIELAVGLAHVMEDCFVAAQNRAITLDSDAVDWLLRGTDLLAGFRALGEVSVQPWLDQQQGEFEATRQQLLALLRTGATQSPAPALPDAIAPPPPIDRPTESAPPQPSAPASSDQPDSPAGDSNTAHLVQSPPGRLQTTEPATTPISPEIPSDRVVRVSAENLNRIMGLAGESLVESNWLQLFADSLLILKRRQQELNRALDQLQDATHTNNPLLPEQLRATRAKANECNGLLSDRLNELEVFARRSANLSDRLYREVIASHMRPFGDGVQGFPRMVRDLARKLGKRVRFEIVGKATPVDRDILKKLEAPLTHILRNSVDHGLELPADRQATHKPEEGTIRLEAFHRGGMLSITVTDDGRGMDYEALRAKIIRKNMATAELVEQMRPEELLEFIFLPGFSTAAQVTEISGRGVGLDIARSMAREVGGSVRAMSQPGQGMSFHFQLPLTLSVLRTLLVEIAGEAYAFPLARIDQIAIVPPEDIAVVENRQYFVMDDRNVGLVTAHQVLELAGEPATPDAYSVVVISDDLNQYGVVVDRFLGERDLVVRPLDARLGKVQDINAAALREDGSLVLIVDTADLVRSINRLLNSTTPKQVTPTHAALLQRSRKRVLIADDSITVREMERKILENQGYHVDVAVDGMDAWNSVRNHPYDLLITDVDMPRMTGIELVTNIRQHPALYGLPIAIVSYKDQEGDRLQGLEAGADAYLTKTSFQDDTLVQTVVDLIGPV